MHHITVEFSKSQPYASRQSLTAKEIIIYLFDRRRQGLALGAANFDLGKFGKLNYGLREVKNIVASL